MPLVLSYTIQFIFLMLLQIFVLDNIQFLGFINPMVYILLILSLPIKFPNWISLIIAFFIGFILDIFFDTLGMHTFATVFLAFIRVPIANLLISIDEGVNPIPSFKTFGVGKYVKYLILCTLTHHLILFILESFSFVGILFLLYKLVLSSAISILLILTIQSFKTK